MEGGIALYERALACNARHADALYNLGVACGEAGRTQRAVFYYELACHFNPACAEAWNNLGVLQRELGNFERAPPASPRLPGVCRTSMHVVLQAVRSQGLCICIPNAHRWICPLL